VDEMTSNRPAAPGLRVAVISLHTSPTAALGQSANGGLNVYVRETCVAFSERGIGTDVFTRRTEPDGHGEPPAIEHLAPLSRVVYIPLAGGTDLSKYELLEHSEAFGEAIHGFASNQKLRYDVIHSHYWLSGIAAERLRERSPAPWVHTAHTLALVKNRQLADGARPEPRQRILAERAIASAADRIVASTVDEADDWAWSYGARADRLRVVPPGVDLEAFRPRPRADARRRLGYPGERLILFVGRLERLKGVEVLLRALALLGVDARRGVRLLVVGEDSRDADESEKARLRVLSGALGLDGCVDFIGSVAHSRLPDFYAAAEACVMPSYSESFGLVALEAQASGCPVIAAAVSGLQSVVRDEVTGFLLESHEPELYADRLRRLLGEPELSEQMGRRGTLLAQRFTWNRTADHLVDVYEEVAEPVQAGGVHLGFRHE